MMINKTIVGANGRDLCWQTAHVCFKHEPENQEVKDDEVKKILSKMSDVLCREVGDCHDSDDL